MGLLFKLKNGETSLKSLRYGQDRPGGGDSGQPFIKKPIPEKQQPFLGAIDGDGLLRGGILAPVNAVDDVLRLTKYLFNLKNPSGLLFTLKQNVLSRVSPKTEASFGKGYLGGAVNAGVYTPLSTMLQAGEGYLGIHNNLLGLDPTGKFPNASLNKYEKVAYDNNLRKNNKSPYYLPPNHLNIQNQSPDSPPKKFDPIANLVPPEDITFGDYGSMTFLETSMGLDNRLLQLWETKGLNLANPITPKEVGTISQYNGGPGSIVGIGSTRISFATSNDGQTPLRTGVNRIDPYRKEGGGYDYSRPIVKYSTPNIYEQSVSKTYANINGLPLSEIQSPFFGIDDYLSSYNNTSNLQPWANRASTYDPISKTGNPDTVNVKVGSNQLVNTFNQDQINQKIIDSQAFVVNPGFIPYKGSDLIQNPPQTSFPSIPPTQDEINQLIRNSTPYTVNPGFTTGLGAVSLDVNSKYKSTFGPLKTPHNPLDFAQGIVYYKTNTELPTPGYPENFLPYLTMDQKSITQKIDNNFEREAMDPEGEILHPAYSKTRTEELQLKKVANCFRQPFLIVKHEERVHTGDPGKKDGSYNDVLDKVMGSRSYGGKKHHLRKRGEGRYSKEANDFVHFRIGIIDPTDPGLKARYMNFRSYIDSFSDAYNSKWKDITYMGRGESFKKYDGFSRDISMAFTVVAHSQAEMCGIYEKLNTLASSVAPTYTAAGYMAGNIAKLTVGGYVREQYGIINSFTYDVPEESSWELTIGEGARVRDELPMMIKVTGFSFTPIYDFVPQFNSKGGLSRRFITSQMKNCDELKKCPPAEIKACLNKKALNYLKKDPNEIYVVNGEESRYVHSQRLCKMPPQKVNIRYCNQEKINGVPTSNYKRDEEGVAISRYKNDSEYKFTLIPDDSICSTIQQKIVKYCADPGAINTGIASDATPIDSPEIQNKVKSGHIVLQSDKNVCAYNLPKVEEFRGTDDLNNIRAGTREDRLDPYSGIVNVGGKPVQTIQFKPIIRNK